ncbi:aminotransferase class I/II-fold pyridoxal phosphate-dependent enzyme [Duganella sp. FT92W]|uniref:Aminotransferase class I/II-fold pyridoxal phosphate-dependent enzyme n=1 Tax=Pseudoduganella rivuli TaxID=2666085 RepID=A0A7X2IIL7_9BURK|nr:PLP-dependent aminotransferase family protein [Pseudoduganella rivuli]MRV70348.1 aminotransferase class I/II-fold pyridoxal phosphate-dependent enzyme [Pseudoduganella rivuli]
MNLYESLAADIEDQVARGVLVEGDRLPSIRQASVHRALAISTVLRAYSLLESRGVIESRPQSGFFVRRKARAAPRKKETAPLVLSSEVDVSRLVLSTLRTIRTQGAAPLGSPYPDPAPFPWQRISQYAGAIARRQHNWSVMDDLPPGNPELIRQIARRHMENGLAVDPAEIVVTAGATEAINLCLQAVAKPGDTVAIESPTFYAMLHAIERMGMRALEVPTDPKTGIRIDALRTLLGQHRIAACMVMPNFQNPLGFMMPDAHKRELVELLARQDIPVIENAVYDELYYGDSHPTSLKNWDSKGLVLHCSSFSKSLAPSYRIGWALPGRYAAQVEKLKFLNTLATPSLPQLAIAEYLQHAGHDRLLRQVRKGYAQRARMMAAAVLRFFPPGTRVSEPQGGYVLWVELPDGADAMALYAKALERKITVGPGHMFSARGGYTHCIRLNYSYPWSAGTEQALRMLGRLVGEMLTPAARSKTR